MTSSGLTSGDDRDESDGRRIYRVTWFAPDRPVSGTAYLRAATPPVDGEVPLNTRFVEEPDV